MLQVTTSCRKEGSRSQRPSSACGSKGSLPLCRRRSNIRGAGMVVWGTKSWDNAASSVVKHRKSYRKAMEIHRESPKTKEWSAFMVGFSWMFHIVLLCFSSLLEGNQLSGSKQPKKWCRGVVYPIPTKWQVAPPSSWWLLIFLKNCANSEWQKPSSYSTAPKKKLYLLAKIHWFGCQFGCKAARSSSELWMKK